MTLRFTRPYGFGAFVIGVAALGLLGNSYRVDNRERAAQRDAEAHGFVVPGVVEIAMVDSEQGRTDVQVAVGGVKRATRIADPSHPITRGMEVRVAWVPADPTRIYIVGERPWTWWLAQRPLFTVIAAVALPLALVGFLLDLAFARG